MKFFSEEKCLTNRTFYGTIMSVNYKGEIMEFLRKEYSDMVGYYKDLLADNKVIDCSLHEHYLDCLHYYKDLLNQVVRREMAVNYWDRYLSAMEKMAFLSLGGDKSTYALTTEEQVSLLYFDRDNTRMLLR